MSARPLSAVLPAVVLISGALSIAVWALGLSRGSLLISAAQAQPAQQNPAAQVRSAVETLIARLRGRTMPDGIVKSNGRIEATQVDVAAKYPGRLAKLTVTKATRSRRDRSSPPSHRRKLKPSFGARRRRCCAPSRQGRKRSRSSPSATAV